MYYWLFDTVELFPFLSASWLEWRLLNGNREHIQGSVLVRERCHWEFVIVKISCLGVMGTDGLSDWSYRVQDDGSQNRVRRHCWFVSEAVRVWCEVEVTDLSDIAVD